MGDSDSSSSSCLVASPAALELHPAAELLELEGCTEELSAECDTPFTASPSVASSGAWIVGYSSEPLLELEGACTWRSSSGSLVVPVAFTP